MRPLGSPRATSSSTSRSRFGELGKQDGVARCQRAGQVGQDPACDCRTEHCVAARYRLQGPHDVLGVGSLDHVAAGACPHGGKDRLVLIEHGQHENGNSGVIGDDPPRRFDPVDPWHVEVHDDDIGPEPCGERDRSLAV